MGILLKTLSGRSSYEAKGGKDGAGPKQWPELVDRIDGAILPAQLDEFEAWLDARPLDYPAAYREPLDELIEAKREELKAEDIGQIVRDRFDFT